MSKEICISTTPHETRLAILENDELTEIYYERENEYTLAGSIYKGKVTRVLPGMQSAFVDLGLERDAFLYVTDFLEEQDDGAEFDRVGSSPQPPRREGAREGGRESGRDGGRESGRNRQPQEAAPEAAVEPVEKEGSDEGDSPSGTRRWRGRRGRRNRGLRPRGQEDATPQQESPEAAEESMIESITESIVDEPMILPERGAPGGTQASNRILLPGESLSKYGGVPAAESRGGIIVEAMPEEPESEFKPNYIAPKPSTLIETPIQWDGVSLLPGESRGLRSQPAPVEPKPAAHIELAPAEVAPAESVHEAIGFEEVGAPHESPVTEAEREEIETEVDEIVAEALHSFPVTDFEVAEEGTDSPAVAAAEAVVEPVAPAVEEAHAAIVSEPVPLVHDETAVVAEIEPHEPVVQSHEETHEHELVEETHEFEPESASASYRIDATAPSEFRVASVTEEVVPVVEHEAAPAAIAETHTSHEEAQSPALEVEYQTGYPSEDQAEAEEPADESRHDAQATEVADQLFGFAPGAGILEEEVIDEEEYDFEPIHAHSDEHDIEELEEETLEQSGAEIGDMVRDAHLNQRLSVEPGTEEEEDDEESDDIEYGEPGIDEEEDEEDEGAEEESRQDGQTNGTVAAEGAAPRREGDREGDRRGGRRGDRRGDRDRGGRGGHPSRRRHGGRRPSAQVTDLPIISELLKQGQEILVQIAKEPIAKKGARITSHIALPGRFLVFMPTVNHVGVSRKISSDEERLRLKRILISEKGDASGGFIVRTAADGASEEELRADLRFLISLWSDIKQREESSKAPALIYHDLNLIERVLRDQVSDNFSTIWVDSETEYERIVRFLNRFQPSLVRRVKLYTKETPLFEQFGIQDEISKALKSKVWLKSGGSIVINQTEALVAIDINTGKYVGKTARLEDTIVKTNLDAIPEIVRQIRLRDLGGIIVIDFIDMDERKNRHKVLQALEEALKADRAPSKVLQFNDFGLVAITRKRVKQSLERTLSIPCPVCVATGMVKSPTTVANEIYVELRKMQRHLDRGDVMLRVNPEVVKTLKANNARWLNEMEEMLGKTIIVKSDPALHPEQFDIH
jgi:Rne/Rng family ribonuclease